MTYNNWLWGSIHQSMDSCFIQTPLGQFDKLHIYIQPLEFMARLVCCSCLTTKDRDGDRKRMRQGSMSPKTEKKSPASARKFMHLCIKWLRKRVKQDSIAPHPTSQILNILSLVILYSVWSSNLSSGYWHLFIHLFIHSL